MFAPILLAALLVAPQDTAHIVIVSTTDVHGRVADWDYVADRPFDGGLVRVATVVDSLRRRHPGQVVLVDAGDLIQGNAFAAYFARVAPRDTNPVIRAMNLLRYDVATPGNHEFNWGLETLGEAVGAARFPYVSGNIRSEPGGRLVYRPYTVVQRGKVRVGVAGFTTPGVMVWDRENVRGRVRVDPIERSAPSVLRDLRQRSDLSVVVIHSGMDGSSSYDTAGVGSENVAARLARGAARPDLVVVGHSHREMRDSVVNGVHFVQPKNWAQSVSVMHVDLVRRGNRWVPVRWQGDIVPLDAVRPQPQVARALEGAQDSVLAWVRAPLGVATASMPAADARAEPTPIIGLIHAVQRERTGAQLSAASAFNIDAGFPAGPIRLGDVAGIYPYENTLRAVRITGAQLEAFLEQSARYYRVDPSGRVRINDSIPGYNFDMVSGASYEIDLSRPVGRRIVNLAVGGRPVRPTDSFTMAVNSYRQEGGGGYSMLRGAPVVYDKGENIRDLIVEAIRQRGRIEPKVLAESNWRFVPAKLAAEVRALQRDAERPAAEGPRAPRRRGQTLLRILTTNDFHGALLPGTPSWAQGRRIGGAAALEALMDSAEAECACPTLWLDGGDQMQGTLTSNLAYGRSTVEAFNAMGLAAAAIGNHDFDWSVDTLRARMKEARYPWLAANVFDSTTGRRPSWARPWAVVQVDTLRVGVIGYITIETKSIVKDEFVRGLHFRDVGSIRGALDSLARERPHLTILVAHAGAVCDSAQCRGEILDVARALGKRIDAVVAGHVHLLAETEVGGVPVIQARSSGTALGILDLTRNADGSRSWESRVETIYADSVTPEPEIAAIVARYSRRSDSLAAEVITTLASSLRKDRSGQYPLGNLVADAQRSVTGADIAIMNNGGIRGTGLASGPVTYANLFELQPFANGMVTVRVPGSVVLQALEHAVSEGFPEAHVSGLMARYDSTRPRGSRIVEVRLAGGQRLSPSRQYTVAVNDFMVTGGSGFTMFRGARVQRTGRTDLEVLIEYLEGRKRPVTASFGNRIEQVRR
ncbi:MAG TPA: 5'-nucleotidase C-terminal domain-containing protein [Gemmatimonadales bacterium]|nr:5'-nucleotidase C-terminal domain-containing protein [Gemmatimonadales bacterium]